MKFCLAGEILPEIDVEAEIELIEQEKLASIEMQQAAGLGGMMKAKRRKTKMLKIAIPVASKSLKCAKKLARRLRAQADDNSDEEDE